MAENIHVDLSEDVEEGLKSAYQDFCDSVKDILGKMKEELEAICERTGYEPMVNALNQTIELFDTEVRDVAVQAFDEWCDGEGSFKAAAENSRAGDAGVETAQQIENAIRDMFENFWAVRSMGDAIQVDTSRPEVKGEDFEELSEVYNKYYQEIEETGEQALSSLADQGDDNPTYNIIIPAVKALFEPVKNSFEQFSGKIKEAEEKSEELKQEQESRNEEAAESITGTTATAADIAEAFSMFDGV